MYKLIIARNLTNGIGINNTIPWKSNSEDMQFFKSKTVNQIVIMGRKTWESLPNAPLKNRINIILTSNPDQVSVDKNTNTCFAFKTIKLCDKFINAHYPTLERWVIGGEAIYNAFMEKELVTDVYLSQFNSMEPCDRFFHYFNKHDLHGFQFISATDSKDGLFAVQHYCKRNYEELALHHAMNEIITTGFTQPNRTGTNTKAIFGKMFEYYMTEKINPATGESMYRLPLLTTKKMFTRGIFAELKWFLNGRVDSKELETKGINIWKGNTTREYLDNSNLSEYKEGETGPIYGFQWKHWGAKYIPGKKDYANEGIDQVSQVIDTLKTDPYSRRHIISGWNVEDLDKMCLPPCFIAGTLVLTKHGYKQIQHLLDNDLVFTHLGNWKQIINRQERMYCNQIYTIDHVGSINGINATEEHPFLVKTIHINSFEPLGYKLSEETSWVEAKDLKADKHVLCLPIIKEELPVSITITIDGKFSTVPPIDYFMVGVYVGKHGNMLDLQFVPPGWSILHEFNANYTYGSSLECNTIPEWMQSLPKKDLMDFIKGFESSSKMMSAWTHNAINELVALSLQRIYAKIGVTTRISIDNGKALICKIPNDMQGRCYIDDQYMYIPILKIESKQKETKVYNLEVADDNSYVVENIATHNCHVLYQFMVHEENNQKYLSLMMTQRSCDTFLGLPFNICSLGMFLFLMAKTVDMKPYKIIHSIANMHIYENHIDSVKKQLNNTPYAFPYIQLRPGTTTKSIEDYEYSDIEIVDYYSHEAIKGEMAC